MSDIVKSYLLELGSDKFGLFTQSLIIIICTFILEDPTTLYVGHLIEKGQLHYYHGFFSLMLGISLGDFYLYLIGRFFGSKKFKWLDKIQNVKTHPYFLLFIARFVPGMRITFYPYMGLIKVPFTIFIIINVLSSIIWSALLIEGAGLISEKLRNYPYYYYIFFIILFFILEYFLKKLVKGKILAKHSENINE